jgi:hypothetical protein
MFSNRKEGDKYVQNILLAPFKSRFTPSTPHVITTSIPSSNFASLGFYGLDYNDGSNIYLQLLEFFQSP